MQLKTRLATQQGKAPPSFEKDEIKNYTDSLKMLFNSEYILMPLNDDLNKLFEELKVSWNAMGIEHRKSLTTEWVKDDSLLDTIKEGLASLHDSSIKTKGGFKGFEERVNGVVELIEKDTTQDLKPFKDKLSELQKQAKKAGKKSPLQKKLKSLKESLAKLKGNLDGLAGKLRTLKTRLGS